MKKVFCITLFGLLIIIQASITSAQDSSAQCDTDAVIDWIHRRYEFEQRFEQTDQFITHNLTDWRRQPRLDQIVIIQNIRRGFEWLQHPPCTEEVYRLTSLYWSQRIDMLTLGMARNETPNSKKETAVLYSDILLPAIYRLEAAANIDYFAELGLERPADAPGNIQFGDITINNTALEKVIAVDPITLPNCNGSSELVISREFSKSTERQVSLQGTTGLATSPIGAYAYIEASITQADSNILTETLEVEMHAAPGSTVTYEIEWVEISTSGILEIISHDIVQFVEFSVPERLRANIRQPVQTPCDSLEATQDITPPTMQP
ncbi:MAG: hypothetical protein CL610_11775 [Anaerolineaceae bacterium]|nr:hypothetical protein [Anaerolineaceae bacterium]